MKISDYVIPVLLLSVLAVCFFKKKSAYGLFVEGSKDAIDLVVRVFPYLITVMIAVRLFANSGLSEKLATLLSPVLEKIGIPKELTMLMVIRPVSGAGAIGVLNGIFSTYGVDSHIGRCASVIFGSSETVFYISVTYFSKTKIRKLGYAIPVALLCTFIGYVVGCSLL